MKSQTAAAAIAAALAGKVVAFPQHANKVAALEKRQDPNAWQAPGAGDLRAPCPGLNTLANHGFINRNGQGITVQQMQQGFLDAFGFAFEVTQAGGNNAVALQGQGSTTFNLDTLNQPHQIEHDGSLSRDDAQMAFSQAADNHDFNATIWGMTLDLYGPVTHIDVSSANTARLGRITEAQQQDFPGWFIENAGGSLAEHGFTLTSMNDLTVGTEQAPQARLDWVNYWFSNERLPTDLGWVKPSGISNDYFNAVVNSVSAAPTTSPQPRTSTSASSASSSTSAVTTGSTSSSALATSSSSSVASTSDSSSVSSTSSSSSATSGSSSASTTGSASGSSPASSTGSTSGSSSATSSGNTSGSSSASSTGSSSASSSSSGITSSSSSSSSSSYPTLTPSKYTNTTTPAIKTTSAPGTPTTSLPSVPAQVTSSATALATQLAGPPPYIPNGYTQSLSTSQWQQVKQACDSYVQYIQTIILGLCGAHSVGSMPMPGAPGGGSAPAQSGAPWYGSMGAPAAAPSGAAPYIASGMGGLPAQNTCPCS